MGRGDTAHKLLCGQGPWWLAVCDLGGVMKLLYLPSSFLCSAAMFFELG